ncbi:amino acid adenylation domain-containing protein, partial [Paenibacillus sp. MMS18-CY102]|uniref:amino acid adenylation domain-containing protein n=1 Tax=Paenibacillus sp. MMS18-CY102 TaxID=2682849 RepID=UPI0030158158
MDTITGPHHLANLIYTSGSTGKPKGVMVEHRNVVRLVKNTNYAELNEHTRILQTGAIVFDASTFEIWGALLNGGRLYLEPNDVILDATKLKKTIQQYGITTMWLTSPLFNQLSQQDSKLFAGVQTLIVGGDVLSVPHINRVRQHHPGLRIINGYGPTENTTFSTTHEIKEEQTGAVPIGRPIHNSTAYVVDPFMNLVPIGAWGELIVGGDGVARGYVNKPELTDEKFIPNPFRPGERSYRTGDLARWRADGTLEYKGRIDEQVKIRGYRIELGELETHLMKLEAVQEAVVTAREDETGQKHLCAYFVADRVLTASKVRSSLSKELPSYMIPSYFVHVEQIPLNVNGKVDRKALPTPEGGMQTGTEYVAPRTPMEAQLAQIWQEVLGLERIGMKDSFFDVGGHSLRATTLVAKMHKAMGIEMSLREVFQYSTIEQMAEVISGKEQNTYGSIPVIEESTYYPVSSAQKRMYILSQLEGGELSYNMPGIFTVDGPIDRERLEAVFRQLIRRHEVLRTGIEMVNGEPAQRVHEDVEFAVEYVHASEEEVEALLHKFVRAFDLSHAPLLRVGLIERKPDHHVLMIDMHHIISDGTSIGIIVQEFVQLYQGEELAPLRIQYKDYAAWQQTDVQSERLKKQEAYWLEVCSGEIPVLDLPTDYARPAVKSFKGDTFEFVIDKERSEGLRQLAAQTGTTLYMVLLSAYTALLSKYSGQEDIIVGTPIAGRAHADLQQILGMFVNTLVMRNAPSGEKPFHTYVQEVKENALRAYENQDYPFEELVNKLDVARDVSRNPLFDTMFILQNTEQSELSIGDLKCIPYPLKHHVAKFDLTFDLVEDVEGIVCSIEYASSLYKRETVERMAQHFKQLIDVIVKDPQTKLSAIEMITPDEKTQILEVFNDTVTGYPRDKTIHQLFEEQAERTPESIAIVFEDKLLTYRELNERANRFARRLRAEGVQPDQPIGILVERSLEMMVGILGILKAGGAYVPIDPDYPDERMRYMLEDSGAKQLLVQRRFQESVSFTGTTIVMDDALLDKEDGSNLETITGPHHLANLIYTSGSTGKPKGVMVEHRNVVRLVKNTNYAELNEQTRILQTGAIVFDASTFEVWGALLNGGRLYLEPNDVILDATKLKKTIQQYGITTMWLTSPLFNQLSQQDSKLFAGVQTLIVGGDVLSVPHINRVLQHHPGLRIINGYGPTENTTFSTTHEIKEEQTEAVPIGRPIHNSTAYVVDSFMNLVPIGAWGELIVGGDGVARGYVNKPELTDEKFIPSPFRQGERSYRTGDLARWRADGTLEYKGRIDEQVKIRGYRIELSEVETHLLRVESVKEAVVIVREDDHGQTYMCAYFVADRALTASKVRSALSKELPSYMIPSFFVHVEQIPLNVNGKVDRKALPTPEGSMETGVEYVAARTPMEAQLAQIWQEVLGLERIGMKDSFFDVGGHSLRATTLVAKMHKAMGIEMSLREVFQYSTIEQMAEVISGKEQNTYGSIPVIEESTHYPVSSAQKRMYILSQLEGGELSYNMPSIFTVDGPIDRERLEAVFRQLIRRHEALRTGIELVNGEPVQRVREDVEFAVEYVHASEEEVEGLLHKFVRAFDLSHAPLLRVGLIERKPDRHLLMIDMHHIISDGTSIGILVQEFVQLYQGAELAPLRIQYKDYAAWQQTDVQSERMKKQEAYWLEVCSGEIPVLDLPTDYARPPVKSFEGNTFEFVIDKQRSEGLRQLAAQTGTTLYMVLLSAYTTLLSKYSGQEDIIVGTPIAGRAHADLQQMLGMFVNTLAMRNAPSGEKPFHAYVQEVKENALRAYENQDYPFEELVNKLDVARDVSRNPLFDTMFILQNTEQSELSIGDLKCIPYPLEHHVAKFDLTFNLVEEAEGITCSIEYASSLYKRETVERMAQHFKQLIDVIVRDPQMKLSAIEMITPDEKMQILEVFNGTVTDYPRDKTIHELFEEQVERTPESIAIVFEDKLLTYRELNERANRLARTLRAEGMQPNQLVGILAERSLEMMVGIMGILKAGGAYVPIDSDYPEERIRYMLEDSGAKLLLTQRRLRERVTFDGKVLELDDTAVYREDGLNLETVATSSDLAYVIYTSGSTGQPKGVMLEHRSVVNLIEAICEKIDFSPGKTILSVTTISFDIFVLETLLPLTAGVRIVLASGVEQTDPARLSDLIMENQVNMIQMTPSRMQMLLQTPQHMNCIQVLSEIMIGGEALPSSLLESLQQSTKARLYNMYGPTETTVWSSVSDVTDAEKIRIGQPLANTQFYVMNAADQLQSIGIAGELCIAGEGLARGYLNRPELTDEKFVANPFIPEERMYRTGDLVKWLSDGNIEYLGRIDHLVKIRGYRIELGEIESQLMKVASVQEAVVIARPDKDEQQYLCAYYVADQELKVGELRAALLRELPGYMVPSYFVQLVQMPLTPNSKIDRNALPTPEGGMLTGTEYVAPRTPMEAQLVQIWQEVLGLERISIKDNFFDIGGHSLRATTLVAKMHKEIGIEMSLREVFQYSTIEQMAEVISGKEHNRVGSIPVLEERTYYPVSSAQKQLYILSQLEGGELSYNLPLIMMMEGALDRERLEEAFRKLIRRHEALRTGIELVNGEPVQRVHEDVEFAVAYMQASEEEVEGLFHKFVRVFDLSQAPLLRVGLIECKPDRHVLLIDMHHIISDGTSIGIMVQEFVQLYQGAELAPLRIQYKDYAAWQQAEVQSERMKQQEAYWLEVCSGEIPVLDLPTDYARPLIRSFKGNMFEFVIDRQRSEGLRQLAAQTGTTLYMVLLSAYTTLLSKYSGQEDIIVGTPIAGRAHADLQQILGMFVNTLAMRNAPSGEKPFHAYVQEVKENALRAYENQDYPFEELVNKLDVARDVSRNPLFDTMFILQNTEQGALDIEGLTCRVYPNQHNVAKFDLTFIAVEEAEGITCSIEYASSLYKRETVERMAQHFKQLIDVIVKDPQTKLSAIEMITPDEKTQILEVFNDTVTDYPRDKAIHQLFEEQVEHTPEQVAVVYEGSQLTYRELNEKANRLARRLRAEGVQPDQPIGILVERSLEMMVGIMGILKAGGAYVPIDPDYPDERMRYMLEDSGAKQLLVQRRFQESVSFTGTTIVLDDELLDKEDGSNLDTITGPHHLANLIYTSGSTGKPKGVMVEHRNVVRLVKNTNYAELNEHTRILQTGAIVFDASTLEIWGALLNGGRLYLEPNDVILDATKLKKTIQEYGINTMQLVTPLFKQLSQQDNKLFAGVQTLIVGGDVLSVPHINRVLQHHPGLRIINAYGPTENATISTTQEIKEEQTEAVPIGRPIHNSTAYVVDPFMNLAPIGAWGELIVGGDGVARGYSNKPELTNEKFIPSPFRPGERSYRTGDLARWRSDGTLEYKGRIDEQVKIRGYRIELSEIETHLLRVESVKEAVVIVREDDHGQTYMCAYFVADRALTASKARSALSKELPSYMIPSFFVPMEQIPLNVNGKVDRKALPTPEGGMQTGTEYVAPRTPMEAQLAQIWQEVLGLERIGMKDNFFDIGGHSLRATTLVAKMHKEMGIEMPLREVFQYSTIEQMAEVISGKEQNTYGSIPVIEERTHYPVSSAQKRMYILSQLEGGELSYNMPGIFTVDGPIDRERLEEAFRQLIRRHEALRTGIELVNGEPVQRVHEDVEFAVEYVQASEEEVEGLFHKFVRAFDLSHAPLLRVGLIERKPDRHVLMIDMHHIISDGTSIGIMVQEFVQLYHGAELAPLRIQYKDYAAWQQAE